MEGEGDSTQGQQGAGGENQTSDVSDVMNSMLGSEPEKKPDGKDGGEKSEGGEKADEKDSQGKKPAWISQLPGEILNDENALKKFSSFGTIGDLAKSYSEIESKLANSAAIPAEDSTDEEKDAFFRKLGKPEKADDYEIPSDDKLGFKNLAFTHNLTKAQAKGMYEAIAKIGTDTIKANQEALAKIAQDTQEALKKEYGDKFNEKIELARRGVKDFGGAELGKILSSAGVLNSRPVVELFIKLGELSKESPATGKGAHGGAKNYKSIADGGHLSFGNDFS